MIKPHFDEFGEPLRIPRLAAGGTGSGSGGGENSDDHCLCGLGKILETTEYPSVQNIVAGCFNQLPKFVRNALPFGRIPVCTVHCGK